MPDIIVQLWQFDRHLGDLMAVHGAWVYGFIFLMIFLELGVLPMFFLPGNPFVFVCGAFCAQGVMDFPSVAAALWLGMVLGSLLNYATGRALLRGLEHWRWSWPDRQALERTHAFCEKYGIWSFLITPYLAVIRSCAPFVGGVARMSLGSFVISIVLGSALWVLPLMSLGYALGNLSAVREHFGSLVWGGIALGVGLLSAATVLRWRHRR